MKAEVQQLGHVGMFVDDLETMVRFYRDELGLTVADDSTEFGMVFLTIDPKREHHNIVLVRRDGGVAGDSSRIQQVSFRCSTFSQVKAFYDKFVESGVPIDKVVSHGNAIGVYFFDPEGNRCEVYWDTGMKARQPFLEDVDLDLGEKLVREQVAQSVAEFGETGTVDGKHLRLA